MAAEIAAGFEKGNVGMLAQPAGNGQPGNAGANDGQPGPGRLHGAPRRLGLRKMAAKHPDANEGGREEENRPGGTSAP